MGQEAGGTRRVEEVGRGNHNQAILGEEKKKKTTVFNKRAKR